MGGKSLRTFFVQLEWPLIWDCGSPDFFSSHFQTWSVQIKDKISKVLGIAWTFNEFSPDVLSSNPVHPNWKLPCSSRCTPFHSVHHKACFPPLACAVLTQLPKCLSAVSCTACSQTLRSTAVLTFLFLYSQRLSMCLKNFPLCCCDLATMHHLPGWT